MRPPVSKVVQSLQHRNQLLYQLRVDLDQCRQRRVCHRLHTRKCPPAPPNIPRQKFSPPRNRIAANRPISGVETTTSQSAMAALGRSAEPESLAEAFARHWPEYLMEAFGLGAFLFAACVATALLEHPMSPLNHFLEDAFTRRVLMGALMGLTAVAIISSPWGKRSGAHINPAVTLTFYTLGKINGFDAFFYVLSQIAGAAAGVALALLAVGTPLRHMAVNYAATVPGPGGLAPAFTAELLISLLLITTVLLVSNHRRLFPYTPWFAGALVALYISWEAPVSGMSMNPARTLASALFAADWRGWWIYWLAPPLGMLLGALLYRAWQGPQNIFCAKLHHANGQRCIFRCRFPHLLRNAQEQQS
jgi:aquaporin Z